MSASWQLMQKMPCEVRAYLKFSIFFLQLRQRKQALQNAWSPVRMARSSILLPQALQLYVQLLQISEPSPSRSRFASESSSVPSRASVRVLVVGGRTHHTTGVASEAVDVPAIASELLHQCQYIAGGVTGRVRTNALPSSKISPHPLHG